MFGNITSTSGSKIIVSADATAIFYNPITLNAGSEFRVNDGSTAVFFGNVTGGAAAFTGSGTKQFENGASALGALATSGDTVVQTGASLTAGHVREVALMVDGLVTITPDAGPAGTSNVAQLAIGAGGRVDLKNNKLVTVTPAGSFNGSAYSGVQGEVARAYNFGNWDTPGLTTSEELAGPNAGVLSGTTTIAVATAEQVLFIGPGETATFMGQVVTGASTIAMYTYAGDMNLDGLVDGADYGVIDNSVQFPGTHGYANGDLNYDGVIDGADYGIIDNTVQLQGAPIAGVFSATPGLAGVTAVPEPAAAATFALVAGFSCVSARRRRGRGGSLVFPPSSSPRA